MMLIIRPQDVLIRWSQDMMLQHMIPSSQVPDPIVLEYDLEIQSALKKIKKHQL